MRACTWSEEVAQGGTAVYPRPCTALLLTEQKLKINKMIQSCSFIFTVDVLNSY
jgi:hypothetical protein